MNAALTGVGALLGIDGPKNVVLAFLNNAEAAALGGGPASQTLLAVDNGTVNITRQVSSADFPVAIPVDVPVDESAKQLYDSIFLDNLNAATSRPDFPTAAQIITANWQRRSASPPTRSCRSTRSRSRGCGGDRSGADARRRTAHERQRGVEAAQRGVLPVPRGWRDPTRTSPPRQPRSSTRSCRSTTTCWPWPTPSSTRPTAAAHDVERRPRDPGALRRHATAGRAPGDERGRDRARRLLPRPVVVEDRLLPPPEATVTTNACTPDAPTYTVEVRLRFDVPTPSSPITSTATCTTSTAPKCSSTAPLAPRRPRSRCPRPASNRRPVRPSPTSTGPPRSSLSTCETGRRRSYVPRSRERPVSTVPPRCVHADDQRDVGDVGRRSLLTRRASPSTDPSLGKVSPRTGVRWRAGRGGKGNRIPCKRM